MESSPIKFIANVEVLLEEIGSNGLEFNGRPCIFNHNPSRKPPFRCNEVLDQRDAIAPYTFPPLNRQRTALTELFRDC
jgi:hypothetical protein